MIYEIYFRDEEGRKHTLFDIEYWQDKIEYGTAKGLWQSEIRVKSCATGFWKYCTYVNFEGVKDFEDSEFLRDVEEIEELRGWLYEHSGNRPCELNINNIFHYGIRREHIETTIKDFANKYNLEINV